MIDWISAGFIAAIVWLTANGFQPSHILAGFLGSIARAFVAKSGTIFEHIFGGFIGSIFAVYFTPIVCLYFGIVDPQTANAIAFTIGLVGMYVAEALIKLVQSYAADPDRLRDDVRQALINLLRKKR